MKENKVFKILISCIVFVMLITGINIQSYATITEATNKGSIIVSGVEAGVEVSIYKVVNVNYDYTADQPGTIPYEWASSVKTWLSSTAGEADDYSTYVNAETFYEEVESMSTKAAAFYSDLAAAIKGGEITLSATNTKTVSGTAKYPVTDDQLNGTVTFTDCEMGTYLILIENGYMVYTPSAVNLTPKFDDTEGVNSWVLDEEVSVTIKATKPQIKKTVTNDVLQADNYGTTQQINYTVVADVPKYEENSLAMNYYISDNLADGLVLDTTSIKVFGVNGTDVQELQEGFTITTSNAKRPNNLGNASFSINFAYENISSYQSVKVTYAAALNKNTSTKIGSVGNNNTAYLDYSNNPYNATSYQTQESSNVVYSYGIKITTVDNTTRTELPSAEYSLSDKDGNALYFIATDNGGEYYLAEETDEGATKKLVSNQDGLLYLYGIDAATYTLKQTKAPNEYNSATETPSIAITDDDINGALDDEEGTTGIYELVISNSKAFILPVTGGIGTTIFVALGVVFVGLGLILLILVVKRRKEKNN